MPLPARSNWVPASFLLQPSEIRKEALALGCRDIVWASPSLPGLLNKVASIRALLTPPPSPRSPPLPSCSIGHHALRPFCLFAHIHHRQFQCAITNRAHLWPECKLPRRTLYASHKSSHQHLSISRDCLEHLFRHCWYFQLVGPRSRTLLGK